MLARLVLSMDTLVAKMEEPTVETLTPLNEIVGRGVPRDEMIATLTRRQEKSDHEIVRELWSCFPGITVETADEYSKKWSIGDIVCGKASRADITGHKLASGRAIGKKAVASLTSVAKIVEVRLLSAVPGISHGAATEITNGASLRSVLGYSIQTLGMIKVGKAKRALGDERAKRILHLFWYKTGVEPVVLNDPGHVLGRAEIPTVDINDVDIQALLGDLI